MSDVIPSISKAISRAQKFLKNSHDLKDTEAITLLADLCFELTRTRIELSKLLGENLDLKNRIKALESLNGEHCPKCKLKGWELETCEPDIIFGVLGDIRRTFRCSVCGFTMSQIDSQESNY